MSKENIGRRFCKYFSQQKTPCLGRRATACRSEFLLQHWFSRSFKANDFHVIWKPICDFLLL